MKLWLDDVRKMPEFFDFHAKTAWVAIEKIRENKVTHISLDHDLGEPQNEVGTGYNVAVEIEQRAIQGHKPPVWALHTSNPVGRKAMDMALKSAERLYQESVEHLTDQDL